MENRYVYVLFEDDKFQVYLWLEGMKMKLQAMDNGFSTQESANEYAKIVAEKLNVKLT